MICITERVHNSQSTGANDLSVQFQDYEHYAFNCGGIGRYGDVGRLYKRRHGAPAIERNNCG